VKQKVEARSPSPSCCGERAVRAGAVVSLQFYPSAVPEGVRLN
jgi:hypothetical protein